MQLTKSYYFSSYANVQNLRIFWWRVSKNISHRRLLQKSSPRCFHSAKNKLEYARSFSKRNKSSYQTPFDPLHFSLSNSPHNDRSANDLIDQTPDFANNFHATPESHFFSGQRSPRGCSCLLFSKAFRSSQPRKRALKLVSFLRGTRSIRGNYSRRAR